MEITQTKVHLRNASKSKLKAFVTITFDDMFVIRDLKVIEGKKGLFVAMPSLKRKETCSSCGKRNPVHARYCSECGSRLPEVKRPMTEDERRDEHRDIAHPITPEARDYIQKTILEAFRDVEEKTASGEYVEEENNYNRAIPDEDSSVDTEELAEENKEALEVPETEIPVSPEEIDEIEEPEKNIGNF